jgi:hypothetical protein
MTREECRRKKQGKWRGERENEKNRKRRKWRGRSVDKKKGNENIGLVAIRRRERIVKEKKHIVTSRILLSNTKKSSSERKISIKKTTQLLCNMYKKQNTMLKQLLQYHRSIKNVYYVLVYLLMLILKN